MANFLKKLDGFQVLKSVYQTSSNSLRVNIVDGLDLSGGIEVAISHLNDSIRLGDGSNFFTSSNVGSKYALDVSIIKNETELLTTPNIVNINVPLANTEQNYTLPLNTKKFRIQARKDSKIQFAYSSGNSSSNFITLFPGNSYIEENISGSLTLYFQTNKNDEIIEILSWS